MCLEDPDEYKRVVRPHIKSLIDKGEKDFLAGTAEYIIVYIRPPTSDPASKNVKKVRTRLLGMHAT